MISWYILAVAVQAEKTTQTAPNLPFFFSHAMKWRLNAVCPNYIEPFVPLSHFDGQFSVFFFSGHGRGSNNPKEHVPIQVDS